MLHDVLKEIACDDHSDNRADALERRQAEVTRVIAHAACGKRHQEEH